MGKFKDISGQKFGRLTAIRHSHMKNHYSYWFCRCDCGNFKYIKLDGLTGGQVKSCGCSRKGQNVKHGKSKTKLYKVWSNIKDRCHNKNNKAYPNYGGRGIAVCSEWRNDYKSFYDWSIANGYIEGLTIDRIDNNGNYEPSNCRWTTDKQQSRNKRSNRNYIINGETRCLMDWCNIYGIRYSMVNKRIHRGWSIERALELEQKT